MVRLGQRGLTDAVVKELEQALDDHELVKIRLAAAGREERREMITALCERTGAESVQQLGATATLFRRNAERPRLTLPD
ncbi:MAG: YhbY family RNA-binding protein [Halofilum sp. (in: g-proteobacteria)]